MSISVTCSCGKYLKLKDQLSGKHIRCPDCGQALLVPEDLEDPQPSTGENKSARLQSHAEELPQMQMRKPLVLMIAGAGILGVGALLVYLVFLKPDADRDPGKDQPSKVEGSRPSQKSTGDLQVASSTNIIGWAWDPRQPDTPIEVDIYDGEKLLATVIADQFREELVKAKKGNGKHRFLLKVPPEVRDGKEHVIRVKITGTNIELKSSPKTVILEEPKSKDKGPITKDKGAQEKGSNPKGNVNN